jgi:alpha-L-arabinofuranosidase
MHPILKNYLQSAALVLGATSVSAQTLVVDASRSVAKIQPTMYGIFFEDINFAADGGLYAELVKNRSFEFTLPMTGWLQPNSDRHSLNLGSGMGTVIQSTSDPADRNALRVQVNEASGYQLLNEGFRGMGIQQNAAYDLSFEAALQEGNITAVHVALVGQQDQVLGETRIPVAGSDWQVYEGVIRATATDEKARLRITFSGTGVIDLDMISLFPQDTWMGRKKGLRKDLVQLLYDLKPGFLRFPGGCIVEGRTLDRRYQWKKTVGPIGDRTSLVNRWNTEFAHRPTPDYYQSFGLGFFEYFLLAEDLGAAPMPILGCGMACQFNTGELVPMDELEPYIQDALDLIEFANGSVETTWGKLRAEMGHPKPFNLKYLGIGNEQWGPEYIKRYVAFEKAIKSRYPDIVLISGSGPFPDGEHFEYGMAELTKLNAEIIDEHYYRSPEWFRENATRYDNYDRQGPKVFAGEYAAQSVAIASPDNRNNWNCALSEAAFMTGLERNADIVVMTSYAPLMAHAEAWQWTPDLIWFDNLRSYGTINYYVQQMYSNHAGTDLLRMDNNGVPLTGQAGLYASAVKDAAKAEIIIKLVNTSGQAQTVPLQIKGANAARTVQVFTMSGNDPEAVNSFEQPRNISPVAGSAEVNKNRLDLQIPAQAFQVYRITIEK